jgi:hypothetical protein
MKFFLVNLGPAREWGVLVNENTPDAPIFKLLCTGPEIHVTYLVEKLNTSHRATVRHQPDPTSPS